MNLPEDAAGLLLVVLTVRYICNGKGGFEKNKINLFKEKKKDFGFINNHEGQCSIKSSVKQEDIEAKIDRCMVRLVVLLRNDD